MFPFCVSLGVVAIANGQRQELHPIDSSRGSLRLRDMGLKERFHGLRTSADGKTSRQGPKERPYLRSNI
jgi:hypothetical protein